MILAAEKSGISSFCYLPVHGDSEEGIMVPVLSG